MTDVNGLIRRIDQELKADVAFREAGWEKLAQAARERGPRLERFDAQAKHIIELLKPRLAAFTERFKSVVKAEPSVREHTRVMTLSFASTVSKVTLRFELFPDQPVNHVRLECTQEIIPAWVRCDKHSVLEFDLDAVKDDA